MLTACGPTLKIEGAAVKAACVQIPAPAPLPTDIKLEIKRGELLICDPGCEQLLRGYTGTREAILQAWPPK